MKVFILCLLTLFLGLLIFLKLEMNEATKASKTVSNDYTIQEYMITDIDDSGYYGKDDSGKTIYFKKDHLPSGQKLKLEDIVVIYFVKDERKDGLVKVEKK
jgi:hypothetical protein